MSMRHLEEKNVLRHAEQIGNLATMFNMKSKIKDFDGPITVITDGISGDIGLF